ncbi:MAG: hydrogenase [Thermoplasmata archaeon]|nr:4Fe-4S dicluster domain-containing protein [Euryarchaeota archaeon]RLF67222.1 MAG: hydrogenase [Thermoplasmata archaeon]
MSKIVTLEYPLKELKAPEEYRGLPYIDPHKCIGCGACRNACPSDAVMKIDDIKNGIRKIILDVGRCIRCGRCEEVCPTGAIKLTTIFEAASKSRENHIEIIELKLLRCSRCGRYSEFTERQVMFALDILPREALEVEALDKRIWLCRDCRRETALSEAVDKEWKWYYGKLVKSTWE